MVTMYMLTEIRWSTCRIAPDLVDCEKTTVADRAEEEARSIRRLAALQAKETVQINHNFVLLLG